MSDEPKGNKQSLRGPGSGAGHWTDTNDPTIGMKIQDMIKQSCVDHGFDAMLLDHANMHADVCDMMMLWYKFGVDDGRKVPIDPIADRHKLAPFTQTVMKVYEERDQARSEVHELSGQLAEAGRINARFQDLLQSARLLLMETEGV